MRLEAARKPSTKNKIPSADLPGSTSRDMGMKRESTNAIAAITRSEVLRHDHLLLLQDFHFGSSTSSKDGLFMVRSRRRHPRRSLRLRNRRHR